MAMKESTINILNYLKQHHNEDLTSADVAQALKLEKRQVDGSFTRGIQQKGLGERIDAEMPLDDGSHKKVKLLRLNEAGMAFDPNAPETPKAE